MRIWTWLALAIGSVGALACSTAQAPPEGYRWVEEHWDNEESFWDLVPIEEGSCAPCPPAVPPTCPPAGQPRMRPAAPPCAPPSSRPAPPQYAQPRTQPYTQPPRRLAPPPPPPPPYPLPQR